MTRQEMLDAINSEMAQVKHSDYGTSYFLPVMIGDLLDYMFESDYTYDEVVEMIADDDIYSLWDKLREPLDKQSDDCIQYVYNLL